MDSRIFFTQRALTNFAEIIGHIAGDDAEAAMLFGESLLDHVDLLSRFPQMGEAIRGLQHGFFGFGKRTAIFGVERATVFQSRAQGFFKESGGNLIVLCVGGIGAQGDDGRANREKG
jgi:plasmid stabilization system protein ParE